MHHRLQYKQRDRQGQQQHCEVKQSQSTSLRKPTESYRGGASMLRCEQAAHVYSKCWAAEHQQQSACVGQRQPRRSCEAPSATVITHTMRLCPRLPILPVFPGWRRSFAGA